MSRAALFEEFGEPADVLQVRNVMVPEPGIGQVRVRMLASPVNPSDLMTIRGVYGMLPKLPVSPGLEGVGTVEANGGGLMGRFLMGKRVAVLNSKTGNWREHAIVAAQQAIPVPTGLPLEQAAMFFVNPATAYIMTRKELRVPEGAWLLQTAAGSALGRMVIRLGRHYKFRTLNVVRREEQADELRAFGGDAAITFDPERHDARQFLEEVQLITESRGVGYAIDAVGGPTGSAVLSSLGVGGRMLIYGTLADQPITFAPRQVLMQTARIEGFWLARWMAQRSILGRLNLVRDISRLMKAGVLVSEVGKAFPLEQVAEAVREAEKPARGGKVWLRLAE
jgi:NADPH:quinone reductase